MTGYARSYTQRRADIAEKLRAYVDFRSLVPTNAEPAFEPDLFENSLMCSWGDPQTGDTKLFVYIHQVPDGDDEAERLRQTLAEESTPAEAYEIDSQRSGEYVFVLNYVGRLTAIVHSCVVSIAPMLSAVRLNELADAALDIGRTIGCSPYVNDFEPPTFDAPREPPRWTTADGLTYDPRTPPQQ